VSAPTPNRFFPFPPNWKTNMRETFSFDSWVDQAGDRSEQTGSNDGNNPRRSLDYEMLLERNEAQLFESLMMGWQSRLFGVPHWAEGTRLTAAAGASADTLLGDFTGMSLEIGGSVVVYADWQNYTVREIESFDAGSVVLTGTLGRAWPLGARVFPVLYGAINAAMSGKRESDRVVRASASFDFEPSVTPGNTDDDGAGATLYDGNELSLLRTNWKDGVSTSYQSDRMMADLGGGKFEMHSTSHFSPQAKNHEWHIRNRAEAIAMRAWLGRRQGQAVPCWMPSGFDDLTPAGAPGATAYLDVATTGYGELLAAHPGRRDIIILLRDGSYAIRRVTSVSVVSPTVDRLHFAGALPGYTLAQIKRISFLHLYRQVDREATITWMTAGVGVVDLDLISKRPTT
jgi:hypothetical protein